jgi:hypothetical protein
LPDEWVNISRGGQSASTPLDPQTVVEEARAAVDPNRQWALFGRDLRATVDRPGVRAVRIVFRLTASDADQAVRDLNDVVGAYAARIHMAVAREVLRRAASVQSADERFTRELGAMAPEVDRLVDRAVKLAVYRPASKEAAKASDKAAPSPFREEPVGPSRTSVDHEHGTEASTKLEELRQRRDRLLLDRTPAHPDVRHVESLIAEAERQLEEVPAPAAQVVGDTPPEPPMRTMQRPQTPEEAIAPPVPASPNSAQWTELFQAIQSLQGRLEEVYREVERTRGRKPSGDESLLGGEDLGIRWAQRAEMISAHVEWRALVLVALAAGLVAAAGIAMVWAGAQIDPPMTRQGSIERSLTLPVIGAIAVDQVLPESATNRWSRARWKWPCIVGGLAVIAAYFVFLLQPFLGA